MQSKYVNENGRSKRIKRKAATEQEAIKECRLALKAWEKEYERGRNTKIDKTRTLGSYMEEYVDKVVKNRSITGSTYKSYIYTLNANFYNYKISRLQLHMLNTVEFELYFDTVTHDKSRKNETIEILKWRIEVQESMISQIKDIAYTLLEKLENGQAPLIGKRDIMEIFDKESDFALWFLRFAKSMGLWYSSWKRILY